MKSKKNIGIFIDHDIMIRHFVINDTFKDLIQSHNVSFVFPPKGHKRISLNTHKLISGANVLHLNVDKYRRKIWAWLMLAKVFQIKFDRDSLDFRRTWRLVIPMRVEIYFTFLGAPLIYFIFRKVAKLLLAIKPNKEIADLFQSCQFDIVINPGIPNGVFIDDLICITKSKKIPLVYIMNSWDNPLLSQCSGFPDYYLAWGNQTKNLAIRFQGIPESSIIKFGCAQFDIYNGPTTKTREQFCLEHGIDPNKNIILYAGGSLGTNEFEHLKILEAVVESGKCGDAVIIYRPHPWGGGGNSGERFSSANWKHVIIENTMRPYLDSLASGDYKMTFPNYMDTHNLLCSVDCVISPMSTILIEAAIHSKPILCFIPLEEIEARHFQIVHNLPHFRELQNDPCVLLARGRTQLSEKVVDLIKSSQDIQIRSRLKESSMEYVSNFDKSYSTRLLELINTVSR